MDRKLCEGCQYYWINRNDESWNMCCYFLDTGFMRCDDENGMCLNRKNGERGDPRRFSLNKQHNKKHNKN